MRIILRKRRNGKWPIFISLNRAQFSARLATGLLCRKDDDVLLDVQCSKINAILIFGNVQFTTQAVHELFEHGIELALLTRTGRLVGQITSPSTKNIELRVEQFRKYHDETFKLNLSKSVVKGKTDNCLNLMKSFFYNHPETDF